MLKMVNLCMIYKKKKLQIWKNKINVVHLYSETKIVEIAKKKR